MNGRSKIKISNKKGKMIVKIMVSVIVFFNIIYFEINSQNSFCNTPSNIPDALSGIYPLASASNTYVVRIAVHLVRKNNGMGGLNYNQLNIALNYLKSAFEPHGICFSLYKINEIWDDNVYYNANLGQLKILNSTPNAIDIYPNDSTQWNQGQADSIPSKAFLVGGSFINSSLSLSYVIAHEMGHCLGLYHTFHGLCEYGGCAELPNGSNCNTCGDYVCGTPADPQVFQITEIGGVCSWNGSTCGIINAGYSPESI